MIFNTIRNGYGFNSGGGFGDGEGYASDNGEGEGDGYGVCRYEDWCNRSGVGIGYDCIVVFADNDDFVMMCLEHELKEHCQWIGSNGLVT